MKTLLHRILQLLGSPFRAVRSITQLSQQESTHEYPDFLWWLVQGKLAGMAEPLEEELPALRQIGIGAIVSLLEDKTKSAIYERHGFEYLLLPAQDDFPPTFEQVEEFLEFAQHQKKHEKGVAVHCRAGWGRTGTLLASYLIEQGHTADDAIKVVRQLQPFAIRSKEQEDFLYRFEVHKSSSSESWNSL